MYLTLEVISAQAASLGADRQRRVGPRGLTIGRDPGNGWIFPSPYISRRHAAITFRSGHFWIESFGRNAVEIENAEGRKPIQGTYALKNGDHIFLDEFEVRVTLIEGELSESALEGYPVADVDDHLSDIDPLSVLGGAGLPPPGSPAESRAGAPPRDDYQKSTSVSDPLPEPPRSPARAARSPSARESADEWPAPPGGLHAALPVALDAHGRSVGSYYTVWFGTNRRPLHALHPNEGFESAPDRLLHVGSCTVKVPRAHRTGVIGSSWLKRIFILGADDRIQLETIRRLEPDGFVEALDEQVLGDPEHRALVYIHGYNTSFEGAALRAAQIGFDLGITGIMAFFTWPSRGEIRHYLTDGTAVESAEDAFVEFLQLLVKVPHLQSVDILAHSMGNRLLLRTIEALSTLVPSAGLPRIRHLLLAAPDVDTGKFDQTVGFYRSVPEKWTTVYTCRRDLAIAASSWLVDAKRLGYEPPIYCESGLDTISASLLPLDWLGHGYFSSAPALLDDMTAILDHNTRPDARHLQGVGGNPPQYWRLMPS